MTDYRGENISTGTQAPDNWEAIEREARRKFLTRLIIIVAAAAIFVPVFLHFMNPVASEMQERRAALIESNYGAKLLEVDAWTNKMVIEKDDTVWVCQLPDNASIEKSEPLRGCVEDDRI